MINIFIQRKKTLDDAEKWFKSWPYVLSYSLLYISIAALFFLSVLPTGYASFYGLQPGLLMIVVFYWSLFLPSALPFVFVFALGIVFDLIMGFPMAMTAFLLIGMQWLLHSQRRFLLGQPFIVLWIIFSFICLVIFALQWGMFSLFYWHILSFYPIITNTVLTILLFPFIVILFHKLRHMISYGQQDLMQHE